MIFCYKKPDGTIGQVEVELDENCSFKDAVEFIKDGLNLNKKAVLLGLVQGGKLCQ